MSTLETAVVSAIANLVEAIGYISDENFQKTVIELFESAVQFYFFFPFICSSVRIYFCPGIIYLNVYLL